MTPRSDTVRIRLVTARHCTVHLQPSRIARWCGATDRDYEAYLEPGIGGRTWITYDNRPVPRLVAEAIEAELTRACVGDRLKEIMQ